MHLMVKANGSSQGEDTYVSVFVMLMSGEFDDHLKWPFRGSITIQLLNQEGENKHYSVCIDFTDETPIRTSNRPVTRSHIQSYMEAGHRSTVTENGGWGFRNFLTHKELTPLYLKNDCLRF